MWLEINNISKAFQGKMVLNQVSFAIEKGKTLAILGKSGCGKTTLLKIIAGLEQEDSGTIFNNGKDLTNTTLSNRNMVYLFQEALLFPHLNVFENIAFGLRIKHFSEQEIQRRTLEMLDALQLSGMGNKMANELSGGQKQRVAFGRSLIIKPTCLLLDEPFSNLDFETRSQMQLFYKEVAIQFDITTIFVTHDLKESLIMGEQFGIMEGGMLEIFQEKSSFIESPASGIQQEKLFWDKLKDNKSE